MKFLGILLSALVVGTAQAETIVIKKLETSDAIRNEYCRTSTGSAQRDCGMQYGEKRLDVIYLPLSLAQKIAEHIKSAFEKKYYFNLNKKDLFHGHFLNRGPHKIYKSAEEYFSDVKMILYHSQEYLNTWQSIVGDDPFVPHEQQRSFVGYFDHSDHVEAAIDLIDRNLYPKPYQPKDLKMYKVAGTIYTAELNRSVAVSLHDGSSTGESLNFYLETDSTDRSHCEIFQQIYILEEPGGRFVSPDGKTYDVVVHCKYRRF